MGAALLTLVRIALQNFIVRLNVLAGYENGIIVPGESLVLDIEALERC